MEAHQDRLDRWMRAPVSVALDALRALPGVRVEGSTAADPSKGGEWSATLAFDSPDLLTLVRSTCAEIARTACCETPSVDESSTPGRYVLRTNVFPGAFADYLLDALVRGLTWGQR